MDLRIGKKVAGLAASAIMASALVAPAAAMADDGYSYMDSAHIPGAQTPSANVATGAACRAAMPSLEILGINSINQGELGTVMGEAMDGVRNWAVVDAESIAEATEWTAANSYNLSAVDSIVNPGQN